LRSVPAAAIAWWPLPPKPERPTPESLGKQLAVIFEGADALAASSNDTAAFTDARRAAKTLLDIALTTTSEG